MSPQPPKKESGITLDYILTATFVNMERNGTKDKLAKQLWQLLREKPFDKVSIGELSERAGISRQTFYYHFNGLFDVFAWRIDSLKKSSFESNSLIIYSFELCRILHSQKTAVLNIYDSSFRSNLVDYIFNDMLPQSRLFLQTQIGEHLNEKDLETIARYIDFAYTGLIRDWMDSGMKEPFDGVSNSIENVLRVILKEEVMNSVLGGWSR